MAVWCGVWNTLVLLVLCWGLAWSGCSAPQGDSPCSGTFVISINRGEKWTVGVEAK